MKSISQIWKESFTALKGNFWPSILVYLVFMGVSYAASMVFAIPATIMDLVAQVPIGTFIQVVLCIPVSLFVVTPIMFALYLTYLKLIQDNQRPTAGNLFKIFKSPYYMKSIGVSVLTYIYTYLWSLLFIIPGIIKSLAYSLAPFVLADNPNLSPNEAIELSQEMMNGHKGKLFLITLSFIGLFILSMPLLFLPMIVLYPYYYILLAKFYEEVKTDYNMRHAVND